MLGTINCVYETPCGWCSRFDKKCNPTKLDDTNTEHYKECACYDNGKCTGTKELDPCIGDACEHISIKIGES